MWGMITESGTKYRHRSFLELVTAQNPVGRVAIRFCPNSTESLVGEELGSSTPGDKCRAPGAAHPPATNEMMRKVRIWEYLMESPIYLSDKAVVGVFSVKMCRRALSGVNPRIGKSGMAFLDNPNPSNHPICQFRSP